MASPPTPVSTSNTLAATGLTVDSTRPRTPPPSSAAAPPSPQLLSPHTSAGDPIFLLAGFTSHDASLAGPLLSDLLLLSHQAGDHLLGGLAVLVLENGGGEARAALKQSVARHVSAGLQVHYLSRTAQQELCQAPIWHQQVDPAVKRLLNLQLLLLMTSSCCL